MVLVRVLTFLAFTASAEWVNSPNCGLRDEGRRNLVTNGQIADPYTFPWQVGLNYVARNYTKMGDNFYGHYCGGAILNQDWILTAAHCVSDDNFDMYNPEDWSVIAGDYNYSSDDTDARQVIDVETFIVHEMYGADGIGVLDNDIALIKLKEPLNLSTSSPWKVNPICLPTDGSMNYGEEILASGWGMFDDTVDSGDEMYWNSFILRNDEYCQAIAGSVHYNAENSICFDRFESNPDSPNAQLYDTGEGVCRGDSGGSAVQKRSDGRFYSEGVASRVIFCGNLLSTIIYAETRVYVDWIDTQIANYDPANNPTFDDVFEECTTHADELQSCLQIYIRMNCQADEERMPQCFEKNPWMLYCDLEADFRNCTEISECSKTVLETQQYAYSGPDYCHESCETCGYYRDLQKHDAFCVTCPVGYEIEPLYDSCMGRCVPNGQATKTRECPNLPATMQCVREPNVGDQEPVEPEWTGEKCSESQISNVFSYAYCGGAPRGSCSYPINPNACAEGFSMCKQSSGDYRCYPVDGVGEPRICEQCFLDDKTYFHGECYAGATTAYMEDRHSGPDGVTALFAGSEHDCAEARASVQKQLDCVKQQSQSDCCSDVNCKWSESAQLCYWESLIRLNDSIICADRYECETWQNIDGGYPYGNASRYERGWPLSSNGHGDPDACNHLCRQQPECKNYNGVTQRCNSAVSADGRCYCNVCESIAFWVEGDFGECSVSCGGGVQEQEVSCSTGEDSDCDEDARPEGMSRSCQNLHCPGNIMMDSVPQTWFLLNMTFQSEAGSTGVAAYMAHDVQIKEVLSELLDCHITDINAIIRADGSSHGPSSTVKFEVSGKSERDVQLVVDDDWFWLEFSAKLILNQVEILNVDLIDASWKACKPLCRSEQPYATWSNKTGTTDYVFSHSGPCVGVGACLLVGAEISGVYYPYACEVDPDFFTSESVCLENTGVWCEEQVEPCSESGKKALSLMALSLILFLRLW